MNELESYYEALDEGQRELFFALQHIILGFDQAINQRWKWKTPFFYWNDSPLVYFSVNRKDGRPYLGFIDGHRMANTALEKDGRKMVKVVHFRTDEDLPLAVLKGLLWEAIGFKTDELHKDRKP